MSIFENKFEIGSKVQVVDVFESYRHYTPMMELMIPDVKNRGGLSVTGDKHTVLNYALHPHTHSFIYVTQDDNKKMYLMAEDGLKQWQEVVKQKYKQRAEWVEANGKKPDLPKGTILNVRWSDGDKTKGRVEDLSWWISEYHPNIVKWKLADDWNEVVDGKAPDISSFALIEVKYIKGYTGEEASRPIGVEDWSYVKKWRFAK